MVRSGAFAILHASVHDASNTIDRRYQSYISRPICQSLRQLKVARIYAIDYPPGEG
jgi:arginyl-tRNA--protein-N-Asp/Glu arginylyltransferase